MLVLLDSHQADYYVKDDPVRPHIPSSFRVSDNRKMFALYGDSENPRAIICAAFNSEVPKSEDDLLSGGCKVATFYTVWSYDKGAGREIVFSVQNWIKENMDEVERFVTLSPPTEMARRFHTKNGAIELSHNGKTVNFEYI